MVAKRVNYTRRNRKALLSQIILPAVFVSISMTIALSAPTLSDPEPIVLSTTQYYEATQPEGNFIPFYIEAAPSNNLTSGTFNSINSTQVNTQNGGSDEKSSAICYKDIIDTFLLPSGFGSSCLLKPSRKLNQNTVNQSSSRTSNYGHLEVESYIPECHGYKATYADHRIRKFKEDNLRLSHRALFESCPCSGDGVSLECSNKESSSPAELIMPTGDVLQNVSSADNFEDYLLFTTQKYRRHR